jgi:hypothetical protein
MEYMELASPFEIIPLNINDQEVNIEFYDDIAVFIFTSGYLGEGYGEITLSHTQVRVMMSDAESRITWRSSPSRTEQTLCAYRGDYRAFTIDRVRWEGKLGVAEVYNRITFTAIERKKLFAKIRSCLKKARNLNEQMVG